MLPWVHETLPRLDLRRALHAYLGGTLLSQGISNVPAAIMLAEFTKDRRALAFGVGVGGFGLCIGSLANLIAMRLASSRGIWAQFPLISRLSSSLPHAWAGCCCKAVGGVSGIFQGRPASVFPPLVHLCDHIRGYLRVSGTHR